MAIDIFRIHYLFNVRIDSFLNLVINLIELIGWNDLFDQIQCVLIQSGVYLLRLIEAIGDLIIKGNCLLINVKIEITQFLEHVLEYINTFFIAIQASQVKTVSISRLNWSHQVLICFLYN